MQYYKVIFSILVFVILLATLMENVRNRRKGDKKDKKVSEDSLEDYYTEDSGPDFYSIPLVHWGFISRNSTFRSKRSAAKMRKATPKTRKTKAIPQATTSKVTTPKLSTPKPTTSKTRKTKAIPQATTSKVTTPNLSTPKPTTSKTRKTKATPQATTSKVPTPKLSTTQAATHNATTNKADCIGQLVAILLGGVTFGAGTVLLVNIFLFHYFEIWILYLIQNTFKVSCFCGYQKRDDGCALNCHMIKRSAAGPPGGHGEIAGEQQEQVSLVSVPPNPRMQILKK